MSSPIRAVVVSLLFLVSCGKKEPVAPPPTVTPPPVNAVAPPPASVAPSVAQSEAPPADPNQGNWWSKKAPGEKQEIMEGWLNQYSSGNAAAKAAVTKEIQNAKLSPADKSMLESLRQRLKLAPIPLQ